MCGIVGFLDCQARMADLLPALRQMNRSLSHRGPDDEGEWVEVSSGLALAHRRLAILDLSPQGHQPMTCLCGRHVISYNGEIYNHLQLASQFGEVSRRFRGHSDTEVLVEAICRWGLEAALERADGMFAFAHWDRKDRVLNLVRDRAGIKPLYFGMAGPTFVFASELRALYRHPDFVPIVSRDALQLFLRLTYVPPPLSIFEGISKLPAGTLVSVNVSSGHAEIRGPRPYWSLRSIVDGRRHQANALSDSAATDRLADLLARSIGEQRLADVPVGAFLSGGVDSSAVTAVMQELSDEPVRTFSIGFKERSYDEAPYARAIANHLGTVHHELYVTSTDALGTVSKLATLNDEPLAEPSVIPMSLLARFAREQVKVVLTGDGGDELLGGYTWYGHFRQLWAINRVLPAPIKSGLSGLLRELNGHETLVERLAALWPELGQTIAMKRHILSATLQASRANDLYLELRTVWPDVSAVMMKPGAYDKPSAFHDDVEGLFPDVRSLAMYLDMLTFLPEQPLTKVDRTTMAEGLEARVPLLDRRIIEFAWQLPMHQRVRGADTKFLLRQVLYRHVPPRLIERPKVGFAVPVAAWLRGPLRVWGEELLDPHQLRQDGYLNGGEIQHAWRSHQSSRLDWHRPLWSVLVFQLWLENLKASVKDADAHRRTPDFTNP